MTATTLWIYGTRLVKKLVGFLRLALRQSTGLFTLAAGIMSFAGGDLMSIDIRAPFYISVGAALLTIVLLAVAWNRPDIKRVTS